MSENQLLAWWQALHPCNVALDLLASFLGLGVLFLMYRRIRAKFLMVFVTGSLIMIVAQVLNHAFPQSPERSAFIGAWIEVLWTLHYVVGILATCMCVRWFWMTRATQYAVCE